MSDASTINLTDALKNIDFDAHAQASLKRPDQDGNQNAPSHPVSANDPISKALGLNTPPKEQKPD